MSQIPTTLPETVDELRALVLFLFQELEKRDALIANLQDRILDLEQRLNQNPKNSSKPPSSEPPFLKSKPAKPPKGRVRGAQRGHKGHHRSLLPDDRVHQSIPLPVAACAHCSHTVLTPCRHQPKPHQLIDFVPGDGIRIINYMRQRVRCAACARYTTSTLPPEANHIHAPGLAALVCFLTGRLHISKLQVVDFFQQVFLISLSAGAVCAMERRMTRALQPAWEQALEHVQQATTGRHGDETSWPQRFCGGGWLWVLATMQVAVFRIDRRTKEAARALIGHSAHHATVTDQFGAWLAVLEALYNQWCWAHLKRKFERMAQEPRAMASDIGQSLVEEVNGLFAEFRKYREGPVEGGFAAMVAAMGPIRGRIKEYLRRGTFCGVAEHAKRCARLLEHEENLWVFTRVEGLTPDNNHAERVLRQGVLWRKMSFGSDSEEGSRYVERILTAIETLKLQHRPQLQWLIDTLRAPIDGHPLPTLLPAN